MVTAMVMVRRAKTMRKKILCAIACSLLLTACGSGNLNITKKDILEVARDDANASKSECENVSIEKGSNYYSVSFDTPSGSYNYKIGFDGIIQDRSYGKKASGNSQTTKEEPVKEEKTETKKSTPSTKENKKETFDENQTQAINAALANVGVTQSDVTDLGCTTSSDGTQYIVTFHLNDLLNTITVDAASFTVLSSIAGGE